MGNICLPCNMTPEESEHYLNQFHGYYIGREVEYVSEVFNHYLFYETWGTKNMRECVCTHTDCGNNGRFQLYKDEDPGFFRHGHGDCIECPVCGNPVQLVLSERCAPSPLSNRLFVLHFAAPWRMVHCC